MKVFLLPAANYYRRIILFAIFSLLVCIPGYADDKSDALSVCAAMEKDEERLQCFDKLTGRKSAVKEGAVEKAPAPVLSNEQPAEEKQLTAMEKQWDLVPEQRRHTFAIRPYRPTYMLPVAYNSSPNKDEHLDVDPNGKAQYNEAKFQISFKVKLWEDLFNKKIDVWMAYTQIAFWQLYNTPFSSPFRDTNYEPELLVNFRTDYELLGFKGRILTLGMNHQSNGRSQLLSRSWNRATGVVGLEKGGLNLFLKAWYRIPEREDGDDNPDILAYMGHGELSAIYYWERHRFAATFRNNLRAENKGAVQLDWCFPLPLINNDRFSGYIQYFNGYGESLLDYYTSVNRISVGFMLKDW